MLLRQHSVQLHGSLEAYSCYFPRIQNGPNVLPQVHAYFPPKADKDLGIMFSE